MENLENRKPVKTGRFWKRALAGWAVTMLASSPLWAQDFGLSVNGASFRMSGGSQLVLGNTNMHVGLYDQYSGGTMNSTLEVDDDSIIIGPLTRIVEGNSQPVEFPVGRSDGTDQRVFLYSSDTLTGAVTVVVNEDGSLGMFADTSMASSGSRIFAILGSNLVTITRFVTGAFLTVNWPLVADETGVADSDSGDSSSGSGGSTVVTTSGSGGSTVVTTPEPEPTEPEPEPTEPEPEPTAPEPTAPEEPVVVAISEGESATVAEGVTGSISETEATLTSASGVVVVVQRPEGSELPVFKDDGSVTVVLNLASGATAEQVAKADGTVAATFAIADADGIVRETKFEVAGSVSFNDDGSMEVAIATESGAEQNLKINADGTMDAGLTVGGVKTDAKLPAGTEAKPSNTGAVKLTSPVRVGGVDIPVSTGLNKSGEVVIKIPPRANKKPVVLPKTPPGAQVAIVGTTITITTPLDSVVTTGRSAAATKDGNFVGRTEGLEVVVYPDTGAEFSFSTDLAGEESLTDLKLVSGTANIDYGSQSGTMRSDPPYAISNDAIELSIAEKSNFVSLPAEVSLSDADLEINFGDVHSVWTWNNGEGQWEAYSATAETQSALSTASIDNLDSGVNPGTGMFVYSATSQDLAMADGRDFSIEVALKAGGQPPTGWHLLAVGNQGDTVGEVADVSSKISTVWVPDGTSWGVYSSDADLQKLIESEGYTLLEKSKELPLTGAIWVYVPDGTVSRSGRVATPPSN